MTAEDKNLLRFLVERALLHSVPYDPGYQTRYVLTYTQDERAALERLLDDLKK